MQSELDLVIHNMESEAEERKVESLLRGIPGIRAARILKEGVWLRYESDTISKEDITQMLHKAGFRAGIFQDSLSGKTGKAS